jgi:hypothetical protein
MGVDKKERLPYSWDAPVAALLQRPHRLRVLSKNLERHTSLGWGSRKLYLTCISAWMQPMMAIVFIILGGNYVLASFDVISHYGLLQ